MSHRDQWTDEHGADGLRAKFAVFKPADARRLLTAVVVPEAALIGEDGEFIFVLRPESDYAAWIALGVYAHQVTDRSPQLAADIRDQLDRIYQNQEPAS